MQFSHISHPFEELLSEMLDDLAKACLALMLVPVVAYLALIRTQYLNLQKKTYRLTVLCVRTAMFLPLYAFFVYISVLVPSSYVLNTVVITVVEGYSFYCFLAMITTNLGGPAAVVDLMYQSQKKLFCSCCCPADSAIFYQKTTWAIFHLFITRSILSVISTIVFYTSGEEVKVVFMSINCLSAVILFYGVICLVNLYENVFEHCVNLFGIVKLLLLKVSVGAIVVQGLIESFVYSSGASPYKDDDMFTAEEKTLRAYCAIVLVEFVVLSFVYYYSFGYKVITASTASHKTPSTENLEGGPDFGINIAPSSSVGGTFSNITVTAANEKSSASTSKFSFSTFCLDLLRLHDVVGVLTYRSELYTPLGGMEE